MTSSAIQAIAGGGNDSVLKGEHGSPQSLPQFPGEDALKHISDKWIEVAETRLGAMNLLAVARGGTTPESNEIKDMELLPELPPTHPQYERRLEHRHKAQYENGRNAERRFTIEMKVWTKHYELVHTSVSASTPMLAKEMHSLCDISQEHGTHGAYYDGPLAWRIVLAVFRASERTKQDKKYYKAAEELQLKHRLSNGCSADAHGHCHVRGRRVRRGCLFTSSRC